MIAEKLELDPWAPVPPPGQDELPYDDGEPMESERHRDQMNLLIATLRLHFGQRRDVFVGGNMALYYSEIQAKNNDFRAPDFFVVMGSRPDRERKSWVVWEEDGRTPDVVIELLSPSTEREDRGRKKQVYAGLKVSEYYLYDPHSEAFEGYRLEAGAYVPMARRPDGDLVSTALGLRLGVADGKWQGIVARWLRWKNADGAPLMTPDEAVDQAEAHARAATERANAEAERARRLEERLRALGVDPRG